MLIWFILSDDFQSNNREYQCAEEKHSPKGCRLVKHEDAQQNRANSTDACPNGIGGTDGDGLCGLRQKHGTQHIEQAEARNPQPPFRANGQLAF